MLKEKIGERVRISYNAKSNEVTQDTGILFGVDSDFVVLQLSDDKIKWIPLRVIVRIEEIE